eukprot:GFUD01012826.1.p1 GENE.GFUD01012826.1~~GFUD01012826.1.p1  ORF type:complete len:595 (+),score=183.59 GFUD01012826.1:60-1844(+)
MDVTDIMAFKPSQAPKRPAAQDPSMIYEDTVENVSDSYEVIAKKRKIAVLRAKSIANRAEEDARMRQLEQEAMESKLEEKQDGSMRDHMIQIAQLVDQGEDFDQGNLDTPGIKKMLLSFEKKTLKNQELRIKNPDEPQKFLDSELELHDSLTELHNIATVPFLYPVLVGLGCVPSLLGLLSHDNTDIAVATVDLLEEMTDVDTLNESVEGAEVLVDSLLENQVLSLLAANLTRLDETVKEEFEGVHNTLAVIENILEFRPEASSKVATVGFLLWIVRKLKVKVPYDSNKLYASEILSILLQDCPDNRVLFGEIGALDSLLQQLAFYKRHDPAAAEEVELMENIFDCLCCLLAENENRKKFLAGEGLQLMNLMLREKKKSRGGALKVLSHALSSPVGAPLCKKFVEILGLRIIFPLFMKTPTRGKRAGISAEEHEEHVINILGSLFRNIKAGNDENVKTGGGAMKERILGKFVENDHEKVDRLVELHCQYLAKLVETDQVLRVEALDWKGSDEEVDAEMYIRRLEGGLFPLQLVDYMLLDICGNGAESIKPRVEQGLRLRGEKLSTVKEVVRRWGQNMEGEDSEVQELLSLAEFC